MKTLLAAQGAFSAYWKEAIVELGGWQTVVGEDIVLTWGTCCVKGTLCLLNLQHSHIDMYL